ncbi:MAG TPA: T9SS type A sorting domain-containing protein, partial [Chitinophagales bacterium]|nr:T9SS type A sorting domain-containing protein [Chitinophagales bacterium]
SEGLQLRMGPIFLPPNGQIEQEWMQQQEVNFPYLAEISKIDGYMNQQSHHFLLFKFTDSASAAIEFNNRNKTMALVDITTLTTSFDGDKQLTASWQDDAEFVLPTGTALFWDKKTFLDMNYHTKNYNNNNVLPCDFYFNIYFKPRSNATIEMKSQLVNNAGLFLGNGVSTKDYPDPNNGDNAKHTRYIWSMASHAHKFATDYDLYVRDTTGGMTKIYEGFMDYTNDVDLGYYAWDHPSLKYWPEFLPVKFGKHNGNNAGVVARTTWNVTQPFVTFGFTTNDEMQLFYYMYTERNPLLETGVTETTADNFNFTVMPNPMNNSGSIVYTLDTKAKVQATVVDVTGKEVAVLSEENQDSGTHRIAISDNQKLSSGIYFARLTVNGTTFSKKFIVTE